MLGSPCTSSDMLQYHLIQNLHRSEVSLPRTALLQQSIPHAPFWVSDLRTVVAFSHISLAFRLSHKWNVLHVSSANNAKDITFRKPHIYNEIPPYFCDQLTWCKNIQHGRRGASSGTPLAFHQYLERSTVSSPSMYITKNLFTSLQASSLLSAAYPSHRMTHMKIGSKAIAKRGWETFLQSTFQQGRPPELSSPKHSFHPLRSRTFVRLPPLPAFLWHTTSCSESALQTFQRLTEMKRRSTLYQIAYAQRMKRRCFQNIMDVFAVGKVPVRGCTTSWPGFVAFFTISFIQVKLFFSGSTSRLRFEHSSRDTANCPFDGNQSTFGHQIRPLLGASTLCIHAVDSWPDQGHLLPQYQ